VIPLVKKPNSFGVSKKITLGRKPTAWDVDVWDIKDWRRE
jgi:hypothetical protein